MDEMQAGLVGQLAAWCPWQGVLTPFPSQPRSQVSSKGQGWRALPPGSSRASEEGAVYQPPNTASRAALGWHGRCSADTH